MGEYQKRNTTRVVLKSMGEPDFTLSGLYGDGYMVEEGSAVVFYYGADELVYDIKRSGELWKPIGNTDINRDGLKESIYLGASRAEKIIFCDISQACGRVIVHILIPFSRWRVAPSMSFAVTQSSLTSTPFDLGEFNLVYPATI